MVALDVEIIGPKVLRRTAPGCHFAVLADALGNRGDDASRNLLLDGEDILNRPIIPVDPQMSAGGGFHQLGRDPDALVGPTHAALDDVSGSELPPNLAQVRALSTKRE